MKYKFYSSTCTLAQRTYRGKPLRCLQQRDVQPIIDLLQAEKYDEANAKFQEVCGLIRNLPNYEAHQLSWKIVSDAGVSEKMAEYARQKRAQQQENPIENPQSTPECGPITLQAAASDDAASSQCGTA